MLYPLASSASAGVKLLRFAWSQLRQNDVVDPSSPESRDMFST